MAKKPVYNDSTEPRKGHFLSDIYQKRNWNKEIRTKIKTKNISFNRLIISFKRYNKSLKRYQIEWELKQENRMEIKSRKNRKEIETINMSFKRLLIVSFPIFSRIERNLLSRLFNLKISIYQYNISIYQYIPGLPLVKKINQLEPSIMLNKRYIKSIKRDIFCFDFLSSILVPISFLLYIGKKR